MHTDLNEMNTKWDVCLHRCYTQSLTYFAASCKCDVLFQWSETIIVVNFNTKRDINVAISVKLITICLQIGPCSKSTAMNFVWVSSLDTRAFNVWWILGNKYVLLENYKEFMILYKVLHGTVIYCVRIKLLMYAKEPINTESTLIKCTIDKKSLSLLMYLKIKS